jgi:hypothetical protein
MKPGKLTGSLAAAETYHHSCQSTALFATTVLSQIFLTNKLFTMKKNMKNLATVFLLMGSSFIFTAAHASQTEPEAVVTFAGYKNTQPVYKLNIKNPENVKLNVVIKDQEGNILYEEVLEGTEISRNYLFLKEELGSRSLVFEVSRTENPLISRIQIDRKAGK